LIKETVKGGVALTLYEQTGFTNTALLIKSEKSFYWGKETSSYLHGISMIRANKRENKEDVLKHLMWFESQVEKDEAPHYYSFILVGYKLLGNDDKYQNLIKKLKKRYPKRF
jgi:hypothetical protein